MDQMFYTNFYKEKYRKRIKVNNKNKYNSLIMNDENDVFSQEIPTKTINSFYIRKNPINLVKNINLVQGRNKKFGMNQNEGLKLKVIIIMSKKLMKIKMLKEVLHLKLRILPEIVIIK